MKQFIALLVRCKNEPYVTEFVNYYFFQGIDKIYIIDDGSNRDIYKDVIHNNKVRIFYGKNIIKRKAAEQVYKRIRMKYEWIIYVDMDEFIVTKKNFDITIREELQTTFKDCDCIKIPWVMMACNSIYKNPASLLDTNIYRWNHDKLHNNHISNGPKFRCRYNEIECKCIFKTSCFTTISDHHPLLPTSASIKIVEGVANTVQPLDAFYRNLREVDIKDGYLLCYHYRLISIEHCLFKIKDNVFYKKYTVQDLISNDYPEIIDETLKNKYAKHQSTG